MNEFENQQQNQNNEPQNPDVGQQAQQPNANPGFQPQQNINVTFQQPPMQPYQPKSKIAAGILGILLGSLGIHNFYLGYTGKAIAQLLITLLTCGFGAVASSIWGLVEGIMILTGSINVDGKGVPLKD